MNWRHSKGKTEENYGENIYNQYERILKEDNIPNYFKRVLINTITSNAKLLLKNINKVKSVQNIKDNCNVFSLQRIILLINKECL